MKLLEIHVDVGGLSTERRLNDADDLQVFAAELDRLADFDLVALGVRLGNHRFVRAGYEASLGDFVGTDDVDLGVRLDAGDGERVGLDVGGWVVDLFADESARDGDGCSALQAFGKAFLQWTAETHLALAGLATGLGLLVDLRAAIHFCAVLEAFGERFAFCVRHRLLLDGVAAGLDLGEDLGHGSFLMRDVKR